jgi:hypothetical protein
MFFVRSVALEAVFGEDGPHISIEVDRWRSGETKGRSEEQSGVKTGKMRHSTDASLRGAYLYY